jgi:preprotein translocase subunit SecD
MARWVKYVGTAGQRLISTLDWKHAGMEGQPRVSWDRTNGWTADIEPLSEEAQALILAEATMVEVSDSMAELEQDSARQMPTDQRTRTLQQRTRTEEETQPVVNAQTNDRGVTTVDSGEKTTASGSSRKSGESK